MMIHVVKDRRRVALSVTGLLLLCPLVVLRATTRLPVDLLDFLMGFATGLSLPFLATALWLFAQNRRRA